MKKISFFLFVSLITMIKAQNVSDYKYISVPTEYPSLKETYGMDMILKKTLKSKKYIILPEQKSNWPQDALMNSCKVLNADILNEKSLLRNKISLQFKDCNNNVIYSEKSSSTIKEFEPGFQDAMKQAAAKLPVSNPSSDFSTEVIPSKEIIADKNNNSNTNQNKTTESKVNTAQKYSKGNLILQKIQIDKDQFILIDGNSSIPFATFRSTAKSDVFRVKLSSGESTLGYYENGNIIIEMPKGNDYSKEVFMAN
ncbi:hypothetical protein [Epilithonimonas mollis]|uniref:Uncharacterized protein n=1 Tax=Epilithonimonas mollis TaxID=216903 RepID=A0A1M6RRR2_9FLAO|nr:hypothetical protein [Epilithonimonas mollis]SHK35139.1 hypothetical protein SAMN05444371_2044 [Epilithonimonas mollis]